MTHTGSIKVIFDDQHIPEALKNTNGWHIQLSQYCFEVFQAEYDFAILAFTRAYFRAYGMTDNSEVANVAFAFELAEDDITELRAPKSMDEQTVQYINGIILGVFAGLEIRYEMQTENQKADA